MSPFDTPEREPLLRRFLKAPMSPEEVEASSFYAIDAEMGAHEFSAHEWTVVRRMIHAVADFGTAKAVRFSKDAIPAAVAALQRGAPIFTDSNMIRAGLSPARLQRVCPDYDEHRIVCHVADRDVAQSAKCHGLPRSVFAARKAKAVLNGGIALFGNAPLALMELSRMIMEEGVRPAFVAAMPVGFVHVEESKEELVTLEVPYIALMGRRGGSPSAVSALHALCGIAAENKETIDVRKS